MGVRWRTKAIAVLLIATALVAAWWRSPQVMQHSKVALSNDTPLTLSDHRLTRQLQDAILSNFGPGTSILTTISSEAYMGMMDLLVETLDAHGLSGRLLVVCLDAKCTRHASSLGWASFTYRNCTSTLDVDVASQSFKLCLADLKFSLCEALVGTNTNFAFFDMDVVFVNDPFAHTRRLSDRSWEIQFQLDHLPPTLHTIYNFGFFIVRASERTRKFFSIAHADQMKKPWEWDQLVVELHLPVLRGAVKRLPHHQYVNWMHIHWKALRHYGPGMSQDKWVNELRRNATIVHLTCVESGALRAHLARTYRLGYFSRQPARKILSISKLDGTVPEVQLQMALLLELAAATGRDVLPPFHIRSAITGTVFPFFRFFYIGKLEAVARVLEPNFIEYASDPVKYSPAAVTGVLDGEQHKWPHVVNLLKAREEPHVQLDVTEVNEYVAFVKYSLQTRPSAINALKAVRACYWVQWENEKFNGGSIVPHCSVYCQWWDGKNYTVEGDIADKVAERERLSA